MPRSNRWPILIAGGLVLLAAYWLLRRRMVADRIDEAATFAARVIQHGEDIGPRPRPKTAGSGVSRRASSGGW